MIPTQTLPLVNNREIFHKDFYFLRQYTQEFKDMLHVTLDDELDLYYKKNHIAKFALCSDTEGMRLYRITFRPEFSNVPEEVFERTDQKGELIYRDFRVEENYDFSVVVGPELLHFWCHKLVWEAVEVIGYKILH